MKRLVAVAVIFLALIGCGDEQGMHGLDNSNPPVDVTGSWSGTWSTSTEGSYGGVITFLSLVKNGPLDVQNGAQHVSGEGIFTGYNCAHGPFSFSGFVIKDTMIGSFNPDIGHVSVNATVTGVNMHGSYDIEGCGFGDYGRFGVTKQ
jgi:hypothetical protein